MANMGGVVEQFRCFKPLVFKGTTVSLEVESLIKKIKKVFRIRSCPVEQKVALKTFMLKGEVDNWWDTTEQVLTGASEDPMTLVAFFTAFREWYFSVAV